MQPNACRTNNVTHEFYLDTTRFCVDHVTTQCKI